MKRPGRIVLWILGGIVLLAVLAVVTVKAVFTRERILAILSPRIEQAINRPVQIGDAGISLWGGIGVRLEGITIGNRPGLSPTPFLQLEALDVKARFWPLLAGRVVVDRVELRRPRILLESDLAGMNNWGDLARAGDSVPLGAADSTVASGIPIFLQHLVASDGAFVLVDAAHARRVEILGFNLDLQVRADSLSFPVAFSLSLVLDSLLIVHGAQAWTPAGGRPAIWAKGKRDRRAGTVQLDSLSVSCWGATVLAQGTVRRHPGVAEIGGTLRVLPARVADLLPRLAGIVPVKRLSGLDATIHGSAEFETVWPLPERTIPEWRATIELADLRWPIPGGLGMIDIPRLELRGGGQTVSWSAENGRWGDGTFATTGTIDRLFSPNRMVSGRLRSDLPLEGLPVLLSDTPTTSLAGRLAVDVTGFGEVGRWETMQFSGRVSSDRVAAADTAWHFRSLAAALDLRLDGNNIEVARCDWSAGKSRGSATGRITGLIAAALSQFHSPDVPRADLRVQCARLDFDDLLGDEVPPPSSTGTVTEPGVPVPTFSAEGTLTSDTVMYSGLTLTDLQSPVQFRDAVLTIAPATARVLGGPVQGSLRWDISRWPDPEFVVNVRADGIEAGGVLARYFGWVGGLSGRAVLAGEFTGRGRWARDILPTLAATGRADVQSARLEAAPLLVKIGEKLGWRDLARPRTLRDLVVPFRIANGRIITDDLRFSSEDAVYTVTGSLGLDLSLDYRVKIVGADARHVPDILRGTAFRFSLSGAVSNPVVSIDAGETGRDVAGRLLDAAKDTLKSEAGKLLKNLLGPHKP